MNTIRCVSTISAKLIEDWTLYACAVGCDRDTTTPFSDVKFSIGYKQFIRQGEQAGLTEEQISDVWDMVKLNLICIRRHRN